MLKEGNKKFVKTTNIGLISRDNFLKTMEFLKSKEIEIKQTVEESLITNLPDGKIYISELAKITGVTGVATTRAINGYIKWNTEKIDNKTIIKRYKTLDEAEKIAKNEGKNAFKIKDDKKMSNKGKYGVGTKELGLIEKGIVELVE